MSRKKLVLEVNKTFVRTDHPLVSKEGYSMMLTPPLDENYWLFRVKLFRGQALVGFPKFNTIGIGFAKEEDWNSNLPFTCATQQIYDHIKHNKRYQSITDEQCLEAIHLLQDAATQAKNGEEHSNEAEESKVGETETHMGRYSTRYPE
jgi:hypothetical protein